MTDRKSLNTNALNDEKLEKIYNLKKYYTIGLFETEVEIPTLPIIQLKKETVKIRN